jgi:hypothetical protein
MPFDSNDLLGGFASVSRAPLWLQLLILWAGAMALSVALIMFDLRLSAPYKFFWLVPYQNLRLMWPLLTGAFRERPFLVTGGLLVPALAVLGTFALLGARLAALVIRTHRVG